MRLSATRALMTWLMSCGSWNSGIRSTVNSDSEVNACTQPNNPQIWQLHSIWTARGDAHEPIFSTASRQAGLTFVRRPSLRLTEAAVQYATVWCYGISHKAQNGDGC